MLRLSSMEWFCGLTVKMLDCRSSDKSSILFRTATEWTGIAQLVEYDSDTVVVIGSSPIASNGLVV